MNKKNVLMAATSLSLVACLSIGATLAYFTDKSNTVTNTFTSGEVDIVLWEGTTDNSDGDPEVLDPTVIGGHDGRTYTGIKFNNIVPGDVLYKMPTISTSPDSVNSYVGVHLWVEGGDGSQLSEEDKAVAMKLLEDSLTRLNTTCGKYIPASAGDNSFTEPTERMPAWTAFRLNDGSIVMVASGSKSNLEGEAPLNQVPAAMNLQIFDAIYAGIDSTGGADGSEYGNELAGLSFELKMEGFAMQADNLPTRYNGESVTGWEYFAHNVVDTCNGAEADTEFESYKADAPFNNK